MHRLRERWNWLGHSWWFQWAHKPLCDAYREDVLRLGRLRLCRGCSALWFGVLAGGAWVSAAPLESGTTTTLFVALYLVCAALSHPTMHSRWPRFVRDGLRAASGLLLPLAFGVAIRGELLLGSVLTAVLVATYFGYAKLRSPRRLAKCSDCPELGLGICSGYAVQGTAIRAWEEAASRREHLRRLARHG